MTHFDKLLNVPMRDDSADTHLFQIDVNLPHMPSAALNSRFSPNKVSGAIAALNRNKASDLYGMRSELSLMQLPY